MLFLKFALMFVAISQAPAQNAEPCRDGDAFVNEGGMSGCSRSVESGRSLRYGIWTVWDDNNQILQEVTYNDQGQQDGPTRRYYQPGGKVKEETYFSDNSPSGTWHFWHANGEKKEERSYYQGKLHGPRMHWDEQGKPGGMECFLNGARYAVEACSKIDFVHERRVDTLAAQPPSASFKRRRIARKLAGSKSGAVLASPSSR